MFRGGPLSLDTYIWIGLSLHQVLQVLGGMGASYDGAQHVHLGRISQVGINQERRTNGSQAKVMGFLVLIQRGKGHVAPSGTLVVRVGLRHHLATAGT